MTVVSTSVDRFL